MKTLIAVLLLTPIFLFAQSGTPSESSEARTRVRNLSASTNVDGNALLPENLLIKLVVADKGQEISGIECVISSPQFSAQTGDPAFSFQGNVSLEDSGRVIVNYTLGSSIPVNDGPSKTYVNCSSHASVRLKIGEPVQIVKLGTRTYQLTVSRIDESVKKAK